MGLQALSAFNLDHSNKTTKKKVRVRKPKDADRDLGGPPGVVRLGDEYLIIEEHITSAEKFGFSVEWKSNHEARSYSRKYIELNSLINDLQLSKEVLHDVSQLVSGLLEIDQLWRSAPEDPGEVHQAARHFTEELNKRFQMIPKSVGKLTQGVYREFFGSQVPPEPDKSRDKVDITHLSVPMPPNGPPPGGTLLDQVRLGSLAEFTDKAQGVIDAKLRDLESDIGSLMNYKVFRYEPELSIHDAMDASVSVDELKENIAMHGGDALQAQANQVPELAASLLMNS